MLAECFEALIGTSGYVSSIAQTRQVISDNVKACEALQAHVDRQASCIQTLSCKLTPQGAPTDIRSAHCNPTQTSEASHTLTSDACPACWGDISSYQAYAALVW